VSHPYWHRGATAKYFQFLFILTSLNSLWLRSCRLTISSPGPRLDHSLMNILTARAPVERMLGGSDSN
jgi:hypothetical protein